MVTATEIPQIPASLTTLPARLYDTCKAGIKLSVPIALIEYSGQSGFSAVSLESSSLLSTSGGVIPSSQISFSENTFSLPAGEVRNVVIDIAVPSNASGEYAGNIIINADNICQEIPITISIPPTTTLSIVDTSGTYHAISDAFQRKCFYANGLFWFFYASNVVVYKTSADGITWSSLTTVTKLGPGYKFSVWFDGTYVHYVYCGNDLNIPLVYRRGVPNPDGTITWSTPSEQTVAPASSSVGYYDPYVSVDSDGYPFIGYRSGTSDGGLPYVTKSSTNDGIWKTAASFPYQLWPTTNRYWMVSPIPLTSSKVYVLYTYSNQIILGRLWNGSS